MSRPTRSRPTLRDVAKACGLAPSTVSNALADKDIVKPETKALIRKVAHELGYRVSPLASGLRTGKTRSVAMIVSDITNPFHGEVVRGAEEELIAHDYHLYIANTDGNRIRQRQYIQHFIDRQVDGVILMSYASNDEDIQALIRGQIPTVLLVRRHDSVELDFSGIENEQSVHSVLDFLWSLGHRRIGFIGGPLSSSGARERLAAYRSFMLQRGGNKSPELVETGEYSIDSGHQSAYRLLRTNPRPTALLVSEDMTAYGVLMAASEIGINVPEELSVVGWDDLFPSGLPQINLTTMRVPKRQLGINAAKLLLQRMQTPSAAVETRLVRPELVVRATTGRAPAT